MRVRNASSVARLMLIVALLAGTVISGLPAGNPDGGPSRAVALEVQAAKRVNRTAEPGAPRGDSSGQNQQGGKRTTRSKAKPGSENGNANAGKGKNNAGNNSAKHKNTKGKPGKAKQKRAPAALDAKLIAAEKAKTVEALQCGDLDSLRVDGRVYCTHGEDPDLPAARTGEGEGGGPGVTSAGGSAPRALCLDDRVSGPRVQIVYVHRNDRANRLAEFQTTFRRIAGEMDLMFDQSARKTGGSLRVRYVTDANCRVDIQSLAASPNAINGFDSLIGSMHSAGYNALDRKYLMLVDASVFCGVGTYAGGNGADNPQTEAHDFTGYARVDLPCWDAGSMAHELSHTLGGVQDSSPNTSRGGHCIDEWDVMCYSDEPYRPRMQYPCSDGAQDFRLDCGDDDYYAARPAPGSYLDTHWNTADSHYLTLGSGPDCVDAGIEPDDAYWYDYWRVPMRAFEIGQSEAHAFCAEPGDTDWVLIRATRGISYQVETSELGSGVDTRLVVYRGFEEQRWAGMDEIAVNDDRAQGDPASAITFTAPTDGTYLVGVANAGDNAGFDQTYTLSITEAETPAAGTMTLAPAQATRGAGFTATVGERTPAETVRFWWERGGAVTRLGDAVVDDAGNAVGQFAVPGDAVKGGYQVEAFVDNRLIATATMTVVDANSGKHNKHKKKGKGKGKKRGGSGKRGKGKP